MTNFRQVTDLISVSPQINQSDIDAAKAAGIELIINNRPDGEEVSQPTNDDLSAYAAEQGINWAFIPVVGGELTLDGIKDMGFALKDNKKTLAYCRSGTRSCNIWGLAAALHDTLPTSEIIERGAAAGYDLSGMAPTFDHLRTNVNA